MKEGNSNLREGFFLLHSQKKKKHFGQLVDVLDKTAENRIACLEKRLTSPDQYHCVYPLGFLFNEALSLKV